MIAQLEQLLQPARAIGQRALLLHRNLHLGELALQILVLRFHVTQADVAAPHTPHARDAARQRPLHLGEDAEGHRLEHRHAGARVHLRGDQQHVPEDDTEEQEAGALTDIYESHNCRRP